MTSRIAEIINSYPPLAFTKHPELIAELEAIYSWELNKAYVEIARLKQQQSENDRLWKIAELSHDRLEEIVARAADARADAIAALAKEPTSNLTSPSQSAIIQGE